MSVTRMRKAAAVALVATVALSAAACSAKDKDTKGAGGNITLTLDTFGEFGMDDLITQYSASHPGITVKQRKTNKLDDYKTQLSKNIATKTGAGDVVALEEGIIGEYKAAPDNWVDLKQYVGDLSGDYLAWKYQGGQTADGNKLIGLPTDIGSWPCATATTCSRPPSCRPTARPSASSGRRGTSSSRSARPTARTPVAST